MNGDILFLCQFFYPEVVSSATLPFDTAKHLASQNFKVGALCGYPKEYSTEQNVIKRETVSNVDIKRIKYLQFSRKSTLGRLVNYFSFTLSALLHIRELKKYRAVIVYSNPPILPAVAILAKKLYKTKLVFVAYDIYPEIGYASGSITKGNIIDRLMQLINISLYKNADKVVSLTDEMKQFLLTNRRGIAADDIVTIANWAHEETCAKSENSYAQFGYSDDQFVVSYFGNMGTCQDIDTLLHTANLMKTNDNVRFLIIGHGNKTAYVKNFIEKNHLSNVQFFDYLTGEEFQQAVAITSAFIVSLEKGLVGTCAPSKYYSYLQGQHPIIAIVEEASYLAKEVEEEKIGYFVPIGDSNQLKKRIESLYSNPQDCKIMGERAKKLYLGKYDKPIAMEKYSNIFSQLME
ncbi:MAG: glycosyltransferase family 4 protein [Clostridia bacterium]|nr:glycosyltransferase family 4 protein [Clostridia bacterium]